MINKKLEAKLKSGDKFDALIFGGHSKAIVVSFVNPYSYSIISSSESIVDDVDYWFSDGALLCFLSNLSRDEHIARASFDFSSIANDIFLFACVNDKRVSFIGGTNVELDLAICGIKRKYPSLNVVGQFSGFFEYSEVDQVARDIAMSRPDILIVGMGTPIQEKFSIICKSIISTPCIILTCGGFITQSAMNSDYYYPIVKKLGLRWLQRAYDFKHVRKRLLFDYPYFVTHYIFDIFCAKLNKFLFKSNI